MMKLFSCCIERVENWPKYVSIRAIAHCNFKLSIYLFPYEIYRISRVLNQNAPFLKSDFQRSYSPCRRADFALLLLRDFANALASCTCILQCSWENATANSPLICRYVALIVGSGNSYLDLQDATNEMHAHPIILERFTETCDPFLFSGDLVGKKWQYLGIFFKSKYLLN